MNQPSGQAQDGRQLRPLSYRYLRLEGIVLLLVAPLLLIPDYAPVVTALGLLLLGTVWLFSVYVLPPPATPFNLILCLWLITLIVGILVSADPAETLPKATGLILGLGAWRLVIMAARTRRTILTIVGLTLLLGLAFSVAGIFGLQEFPKIPALARLNPFQSGQLPGLEGLIVHPNQLAGLICLLLPLLASLLIAPPAEFSSRPRRVVIFLATLWTAWILLLTQSRGGWIGVGVGLVALLVLWIGALPPSRTRLALGGLFATIALLGVAVVLWIGPGTIWNVWLDPPQETAVGTLKTLNFRKELWPWAVTAIADFPISGVGLGAFRQVAFRLYPLPMSSSFDIAHAHNIFLQTALDVGLPGLAAYLALLFAAAAVGWRIARRGVGYRSISLGVLAGLVAVHVFGLADALALGSKPGLVFWLALGLLGAMNGQVAVDD
ncbi:MAG: O-antigen ligase family protein [Candidatus Promineofilum sp.]|nr:O-antigen ligase family protein [Promineifilum sp.]